MSALNTRMKSHQYKHLYKTKAWQNLRHHQLWTSPLCAFCEAIATVADHITPHKGCPTLFHDPDNLQSLCKSCHDSTKKQIEMRGYHSLTDEYGRPTDPLHPFNKK